MTFLSPGGGGRGWGSTPTACKAKKTLLVDYTSAPYVAKFSRKVGARNRKFEILEKN